MVTKNHLYLQIDYFDEQQKGGVASLMSFEKNVVLSWLILGLAFLGLTLVKPKWPSIVAGFVMVATMLSAVVLFAVGIAGAVSKSYAGDLPFSPPITGFIGSMNSAGGVLSWGPSWGWFIAIGACASQAFALLLVATRVLSGRTIWKA